MHTLSFLLICEFPEGKCLILRHLSGCSSIAQYSLLFIITAKLSSCVYYESDIVLTALPSVLFRVLQRNRINHTNIYAYVHIIINKLIIRNWIMQLWRLRSPKICSWQAGHPGKPMFQPKSECRKRPMSQHK